MANHTILLFADAAWKAEYALIVYLIFMQAAEENAQNDDDEVFKSLIELCEDAPNSLRSHIELVLSTCLKVGFICIAS